ncbi:MAG: glycosyltransferase family 2 protein [Bacilli bacterium]|nr:glycosyltransferase family 2 protein [Bacilli bacterium]
MKKKKVLFIIPAYNEEENILNTYNQIKNKKRENWDVIVINDGSKDNTEEVLRNNNIPHIQLIQNLGIGGAVQTGYKYAYYNDYDVAVQFDGDGQHDVDYADNIINPVIEDECDMCIGSRFVKKDKSGFKSTAARRMGIKLISFEIKLFTGKRIKDTTSGFRAVNKELIELFSNNYPTEYPEPVSEVSILRRKYRIKEEQVVMKERQGGKSSIHAWKNVYYMINVSISMFIERLKRY